MDEETPTNSLEAKHKKERKELQAQIQALKKIAKNDKTKRKDLTAEISKLETDLESRQKYELEQYKESDTDAICEEESVQEITNELTRNKISKAQKRRNKKSQLEQMRIEQIKLQEQENLNGPRNIELKTITAKLKENKLQIFPIPSDGDCLYNAVAHQLRTVKGQSVTVTDLRKNVASYIKEHKDDFLPFMINHETFEMLNDSQFDEYCDKICTTKVWGGQLEIRALSNYFKCPIHVIQSSGPDCIEQGSEFEGQPLTVTYHRHMYSLGEHYNSTQILNDNNYEDDN